MNYGLIKHFFFFLKKKSGITSIVIPPHRQKSELCSQRPFELAGQLDGAQILQMVKGHRIISNAWHRTSHLVTA